MNPLRLGFIGGGINSAVGRAHYAACRMDGRFELIGGRFSRDSEENEKSAEYYGAEPMSFFHPSEFDAVVILTPTPRHAGDVESLLDSEIPVICEKALSSTPAESAHLIEFRNSHKGFLAVTYNYTGYPMVRELRYLVQGGELGKIISVQAEMPQEGYLRDNANPQQWRKEDGPIPAVHLDLGTHLHHLIHFVTDGRPTSLVAHQRSDGDFYVIDGVRCIAEYDQDFVADIRFGKTSIGHRNGLRIRVEGTAGSAEWIQSNPEEISLAYADGVRMTIDRASAGCKVANQARYQRFKAGHPAGFIEAYANLYYDLADWLGAHKNGETQDSLSPRMELYSAEIAHEGLVMMEAMVQSAKEKKWVAM